MVPLSQYYDRRGGKAQQSIAIAKNLVKLKLDAMASEVRTLSTIATIDAAANERSRNGDEEMVTRAGKGHPHVWGVSICISSL